MSTTPNQDKIFELATALGQALKAEPSLVKLEQAKAAYEADADLKRKMIEYEVQEKAMQAEASKADRNSDIIGMIQNRINVLYREIAEHPAFVALNEAQNEVNELMNRVNSTIMFNVTGEDPNCTHDCSTCGGHCHG